MQVGPFILLTFVFTAMLLLIQRTEPRRRILTLFIMVAFGALVVYYINFRGYQVEGRAAFIVAFVLNFLFWALIGRYNPVKASAIKVLGMDD
jgi:hypothetical protein